MAARTTLLRQAIRSAAVTANDRELLARFAEGDEAAFAALVARHSGMVLGVCRRLLPTVQDAEDACQATFLVLAKKAGSGRWQPSVANWLYATARHVAARARRAAQRRSKRERKAALPEAVEPIDRLTARELLAALDEELDRLPPTYREALVLCYLEGLTRDEAAARLGVPAGTVKIRLERGRKRLGDALTGRGWAPGISLVALAATSPAGTSPPRLVQGVLAAVRGSPPAAVAALAKGVAMNGLVNKSLVLLLALAGAAALGIGLGLGSFTASGQEGDPKAPAPAGKEAARPPEPAPEGEKTYAGRVLDPDGKPVAGAKLYVLYYTPADLPVPPRGATDKDGAFRFTIPHKEFDRSYVPRPWEDAYVVAAADGYGLAVPDIRPGKSSSHTGLTLHLSKDDEPITGRVLDLEGKPVAGATVSVHSFFWPSTGDDLTPWLARLKESQEGYPALREHLAGLEGGWMGRDVGKVLAPAVTDKDGRFRLEGVGRERVVALRIEGPTIASAELWAMTRPGDKVRAARWRRGELGDEMTFVGSTIEHFAAPCRPIVGVVRDKDTGKPLPGAVVQSYHFAGRDLSDETHLQAVTDKEGRYRLLGMPKGEGNAIRVCPPDGQPYLMSLARVPDAPGLEPVTVDVELKRGVWITGKVTDKATGKPVHSQIHYVVFPDNPFRKEAPGRTFDNEMQTRAEDGTFRFVGLPGRGMVAARSWTPGYLNNVGADRIKGFEETWFPGAFHALAEVDPDKGAESVTCNLVLDPGRTLTGTVLGPDGKPLPGARGVGLRALGLWEHEPAKTAEFTVLAVAPGKPRLLQFIHKEKGLAGSLVVRGDEEGPLSVKLAPAATLTGRFVTTEGKPLADLELVHMRGEAVPSPRHRPKPDLTSGWFPDTHRTDTDGKFRIEGLAPGLTYRLALHRGMYLLQPEGEIGKGVTVKAGEAKDLGEVKVKLPDE